MHQKLGFCHTSRQINVNPLTGPPPQTAKSVSFLAAEEFHLVVVHLHLIISMNPGAPS